MTGLSNNGADARFKQDVGVHGERRPVHLGTIPGLITERETTATATAGQLREQITQLTAERTRIGRELADLATTPTVLQNLAATEFTADDPTIVSSVYQQILAILSTATASMGPRTSASPSTSSPSRNTSKAPERG
ncbi:hypothetical protein [Actinoplanes regularis]|uniref:hypothetical protein n=1 Tax=Actinoplanes regularis TaxID=52697 RepID=UPI0024A049BF|nr:hypothetical protein [Actinoplanes regularis]GLW35486.1 hypothetical protein Areg01_84210 [Actinoplanes regularis]